MGEMVAGDPCVGLGSGVYNLLFSNIRIPMSDPDLHRADQRGLGRLGAGRGCPQRRDVLEFLGNLDGWLSQVVPVLAGRA